MELRDFHAEFNCFQLLFPRITLAGFRPSRRRGFLSRMPYVMLGIYQALENATNILIVALLKPLG